MDVICIDQQSRFVVLGLYTRPHHIFHVALAKQVLLLKLSAISSEISFENLCTFIAVDRKEFSEIILLGTIFKTSSTAGGFVIVCCSYCMGYSVNHR